MVREAFAEQESLPMGMKGGGHGEIVRVGVVRQVSGALPRPRF